MTLSAYPSRDIAFRRLPARRRKTTSALPCAIVLVLGGAIGGCLLYAAPPADTSNAGPILARAVLPTPTPPAVASHAVPLDPAFTAPDFIAGQTPAPLAARLTIESGFLPFTPFQTAEAPEAAPAVVADNDAPEAEAPAIVTPALAPPPALVVENLPVPPARPASAVSAPVEPPAGRRQLARLLPPPVAPAPQPARGVFEKLFGKADPPPGPALAYAAPEDGAMSALRSGAPERLTAVYDIAHHTVTLPDGTRLEAHSGIGGNKDDPRSVAQHMRGATPPAVYDLTPREALFHGVAALRLTPVGGAPYGRLGLLAHTYMLGPRGDSNGCVVFRDYAAFLRAYQRGAIRRLVVVSGA